MCRSGGVTPPLGTHDVATSCGMHTQSALHWNVAVVCTGRSAGEPRPSRSVQMRLPRSSRPVMRVMTAPPGCVGDSSTGSPPVTGTDRAPGFTGWSGSYSEVRTLYGYADHTVPA